MWGGTKDGRYTVRSRYHKIKEWETQKENEAQPSLMDSEIWKKIWNLAIPPKQVVLVWKILNNAIPVRANLRTKGVKCPMLCPRCENKIETVDHTFRDCIKATQIWLSSTLGIRFNDNPTEPFS